MSIVAVSDVHLGMKGAKENEFVEFIDYLKDREIEHLVLLGDIIELWRRDLTQALIDFSGTMTYLDRMLKGTQIHYVAGNHDYYMLHLDGILKNDLAFKIKKQALIRSKEQDFFFFHGYQLEVLCNHFYRSMKVYETFCEQMCLASDITGNAADKLWEKILSKRSLWDDMKKLPNEPRSAFMSMREPPERRIRTYLKNNIFREMRDLAGSDARHFQLHMCPEQYLIYGHTHDAYVDDGRRVANTGSWGFGDEHKLEYIEIIDDKVELKDFNPYV